MLQEFDKEIRDMERDIGQDPNIDSVTHVVHAIMGIQAVTEWLNKQLEIALMHCRQG